MEKVGIRDWLPDFQVSAETDDDLQEYFFTTPEIKKIVDSRSWLILGRKGTGKTAIYKYLETADREKLNGYITVPLNFKDYPWPIHRLYKESLAGELAAYQKSWKYLFYVKAVAKLIEQKEADGVKLSSDLKWAKKYINKVYGRPDPSILEVLQSKITSLEKIKAPGGSFGDVSLDGGEISFESINQSKELQTKLRANAFTLLSYFEKIYTENVEGYKFMIILDQLDENWLVDEIDEL